MMPGETKYIFCKGDTSLWRVKSEDDREYHTILMYHEYGALKLAFNKRHDSFKTGEWIKLGGTKTTVEDLLECIKTQTNMTRTVNNFRKCHDQ